MAEVPAIPERIGYMKEIGLDYGWGPTALVEWLLEHVHVYTGTSWGVAVIITAFLVRLALFKGYIEAADTSGRLAAIREYIKPLQTRLQAARRSGDQSAMLLATQELKALYRSSGIKVWKMGLPLIQLPIGFGTFRLLRGMVSLPVPGLDESGFLWIKDLTVGDPLFILPVLTTVAIHYAIKVCNHRPKPFAFSPEI